MNDDGGGYCHFQNGTWHEEPMFNWHRPETQKHSHIPIHTHTHTHTPLSQFHMHKRKRTFRNKWRNKYNCTHWEVQLPELRRRKRIESNKATHDITKAALDPTVYLAEVSLKAFQCVSFPFALVFILFIAILCLGPCCLVDPKRKRDGLEGVEERLEPITAI